MSQSFYTPEYLEQIEAQKRKREMAERLAQSRLPMDTQMVSGHAVKNSPLLGVANVLSAYLGNKRSGELDKEIQDTTRAFSDEESGEFQSILGMGDPQAQIAAALGSKFPKVQGYGAQMKQSRDARMMKIGEVGAGVNPVQGMEYLRRGDLGAPVPQPLNPEPTFGSDTQGNPYALTRNNRGEPKLDYAPKAPTVSVNQRNVLPNKEGELILTREQKDLEERQTMARNAMSELGNAQRMTQLLEQGAKVGGGQEYIQTARKAMQAFGIDLPETGVTEQLARAMGERVLDRAKSLGHNPSNADREFITAMMGNLNSDPSAVVELTQWMTAVSLKSLQDFEQFLAVKREQSPHPDLYATADVGIRMPSELFGNPAQQFGTVGALKQVGGDVSRFRNPSGQPFSPNDQFNIKAQPATPGLGTPALPPGMRELRGPRGR